MIKSLSMSNNANVTEQNAPIPNSNTAVWETVIKDMQDRDAVGRARYGTPFQPFNGRKQLLDAYQEMLDHIVYIKAELLEREAKDELMYRAVGVLSSCASMLETFAADAGIDKKDVMVIVKTARETSDSMVKLLGGPR